MLNENKYRQSIIDTLTQNAIKAYRDGVDDGIEMANKDYERKEKDSSRKQRCENCTHFSIGINDVGECDLIRTADGKIEPDFYCKWFCEFHLSFNDVESLKKSTDGFTKRIAKVNDKIMVIDETGELSIVAAFLEKYVDVELKRDDVREMQKYILRILDYDKDRDWTKLYTKKVNSLIRPLGYIFHSYDKKGYKDIVWKVSKIDY